MAIIDIARKNVVTMDVESTAKDVIEKMDEERIGSIIITKNNKLEGIVTDRDIAIEINRRNKTPGEIPIKKIMTEKPFTVRKDEGIFEVIRKTADEQVRRIPIVEENGDLAGIITIDDLLVLLATEFNSLSRVIQSESPVYETP